MGSFEKMCIYWPPVGWASFGFITASSGQAVAKDIGKGKIFGLQYRIDSHPLFKNETRFYRHDVVIEGWEYSILNESTEYPVLSFSVMDRFDPDLPRECFVSDIRSYDTAIAHTRRSATRAVGTALFLIRQIAAGNVPDINRVIRTYKLHPNQSFLYRNDRVLTPDLKKAFDLEQAQAMRAKA
jgi:DNA relaxase NicK